jgi:hypothetical protein
MTIWATQLVGATRRQRVARLMCLCAIIAIVTAALWIVRAIRTAFEAETNLHAIACVTTALQSFVSEHNSWPSSWEELAKQPGPSGPSVFQLPRDLDIVRSRVKVRFDVTLNDFARPQSANLLEPLGPCYDYEYRLQSLYEQLSDLYSRERRSTR